MALLTRDQILEADDLKTKDVSVPEWGGTVRVRMMTGSDRDNYEQVVINSRGKDGKADMENIRATLLAFVLVDEEGKRLFNKDDIIFLGNKSIKALSRVFDAATELNALTEDDVEDLAGN